jgi:hypothetical protein
MENRIVSPKRSEFLANILSSNNFGNTKNGVITTMAK